MTTVPENHAQDSSHSFSFKAVLDDARGFELGLLDNQPIPVSFVRVLIYKRSIRSRTSTLAYDVKDRRS
jgi:hypothetical protein